MYNPKIKEIKPLQCLNCGSQTTSHREHPTVKLSTVECRECNFNQVMQLPIYRELRVKWLKYKIEQYSLYLCQRN